MTSYYSSAQDFGAQMAASYQGWLRLAECFPETATRTEYHRDYEKMTGELHRAMGWRADHHDRY